jgi:RND superfamily putative drug exporter
MTKLDEAPNPTSPGKARRPRVIWVFGALALIFFLVGLAGGNFLGKLQNVQKNDNSSFLPGSADSTKVANAQEQFISVQTIPGFVVYKRTNGPLTAADKAKINSDVVKFRAVPHISSDGIGAPQFSTKDSSVASVSVPLIGKQGGKTTQGPDLVNAEKDVLKIARQDAPSGLEVHSAGAGGLIAAFIDAFSGLDGTLLLAAGLVVIVILLFVYRSPVLWFFPLFCAALALGASAIVIYGLAKSGTITLNGQSQGILSVLVIGAGTDYALLLISRYREELHEHQSRVSAMVAAWKGVAQPILASATTVILGLICLTFAELNSTAGLGPVCAIGIAATVLVMLTVLPALLVLAGRWIFWPKRPSLDHEMDIENIHGVWSRFAKWLQLHHRRSWVGAAILLVACIALISGLKTDGLPTQKSFTTHPEVLTGQKIYDANFGAGNGAPAQILANADSQSAVIAAARAVSGVVPDQVCVETDFAKVAVAIKAGTGQPVTFRDANGCALPAFQVSPHGGKTLIDATLTTSFDSQQAYQTVRDLRAAMDKVQGADALVGGQSAANLDVQDAARHDNKLIIPIVLLVILVVLGLVLRALVAPILLIVTVVLSFAAALGVSGFAFNHIFHFANADPGFPLFAFIFLVALGIDYNIFLMTRVREETLEYGTHRGITRGLTVTGGVITSAGFVLAATFVVLGVLPIIQIAEIGFAVAFGVLLDTIVVRSILVPALSHEIGKKIWWPSKVAAAEAAD